MLHVLTSKKKKQFLLYTLYLFQEDQKKSRLDHCATCIQRHFRGYQGRKKYVELLYQQFTKVNLSKLHDLYKFVC